MFFAQTDLPSVPAETLKWVLVILVAIVLIGLAVFTAIHSASKKSMRLEEPMPELRKAPKRYNHDANEQRFGELERRIVELEEWRDGLIEKLELDKMEILKAGDTRKDQIEAHIENVRKELDGKISNMPDRIVALLRN